jgi:hypothetical protein
VENKTEENMKKFEGKKEKREGFLPMKVQIYANSMEDSWKKN